MSAAHLPYRLDTGFDSRAKISQASKPDTAVVFVHGFRGNPETTWLDFQTLIDTHPTQQHEWQRCDLFFFGYPSLDKPIRYNANRLRTFISRIYPVPDISLFQIVLKGQAFIPVAILRSGSLAYRRLVLVGHSEGAVVLRTMIRDDAFSYEVALRAELEHQASKADRTTSAPHELPLEQPSETNRKDIGEKILRERPEYSMLSASLRLFAPAHAGHSISGVFGVT